MAEIILKNISSCLKTGSDFHLLAKNVEKVFAPLDQKNTLLADKEVTTLKLTAVKCIFAITKDTLDSVTTDDEACDLVACVWSCYRHVANFKLRENDPLAVLKYLYSIATKFISKELFKASLRLSSILLDDLQKICSEAEVESAGSLASGMYAACWNAALREEQKSRSDPCHVFRLRIQALQFLLYTGKDISSLSSKAEITFIRYYKYTSTSSQSGEGLEELATATVTLCSNLVSLLGTCYIKESDNACLSLFEVASCTAKAFLKYELVKPVALMESLLTKSLKQSVISKNLAEHLSLITCVTSTAQKIQAVIKDGRKKEKEMLPSVKVVYVSLSNVLGKLDNFKIVQLLSSSLQLITSLISGDGKSKTESETIFGSLPHDLQLGLLDLFCIQAQLYKKAQDLLLQDYTPDAQEHDKKRLQVMARKAVWWKAEMHSLYLHKLRTTQDTKFAKDIQTKGLQDLKELGKDVTAGITNDPVLLQDREYAVYANLCLKYSQAAQKFFNLDIAVSCMTLNCAALRKYCWGDRQGSRIKEVQLGKNYDFLCEMLRKQGSYKEALDAAAEGILSDPSSLSALVERWARIKADLNHSDKGQGLQAVLSRSLWKHLLLEGGSIPTLDAYQVHTLELKFLKARANSYSLQIPVAENMLEFADSDVQKAGALVEMAQIYWANRQQDKDPAALCKDCIQLLENAEKEGTNYAVQQKVIKAKALVWMYVVEDTDPTELKDMKIKSQKQEGSGGSEDKPESSASEDEEMDSKCITVTMETRSLEPLEQAVCLLKHLADHDIDKLQTVDKEELLGCAGIVSAVYTLALMPLQTLEILSVQEKLAVSLSAERKVLQTRSSTVMTLLSLGQAKAALALVDKIDEDIATIQSSDMTGLRASAEFNQFLLRKAETLLMNNNVLECHQVLQEALNLQETYFKLQTRQKLSLEAATKQLQSKLYSTQSESLVATVNNQPLEDSVTAARNLSCVANSALGGWIITSSNSSGKVTSDPDNTAEKWALLAELLDALLQLGTMFVQVGEPRQARCYLRQGQRLAQGFNLPRRLSQYEIALGELAALCGQFGDCEAGLHAAVHCLLSSDEQPVKIKGATGNMSKKTNPEQAKHMDKKGEGKYFGFECSSDENDNETEFMKVKKLSLGDAKEMDNGSSPKSSPSLKTATVASLELLTHPFSCRCGQCVDVTTHSLYLQYILLFSQMLKKQDKLQHAKKILIQAFKKLNVLEKKGKETCKTSLKELNYDKILKSDKILVLQELYPLFKLDLHIGLSEVHLDMKNIETAHAEASKALALVNEESVAGVKTWVFHKAWLLYMQSAMMIALDDKAIASLGHNLSLMSLHDQESEIITKDSDSVSPHTGVRRRLDVSTPQQVKPVAAERSPSFLSALTPQKVQPGLGAKQSSRVKNDTPDADIVIIPKPKAPRGRRTVKMTRLHAEPDEPNPESAKPKKGIKKTIDSKSSQASKDRENETYVISSSSDSSPEVGEILVKTSKDTQLLQDLNERLTDVLTPRPKKASSNSGKGTKSRKTSVKGHTSEGAKPFSPLASMNFNTPSNMSRMAALNRLMEDDLFTKPNISMTNKDKKGTQSQRGSTRDGSSKATAKRGSTKSTLKKDTTRTPGRPKSPCISIYHDALQNAKSEKEGQENVYNLEEGSDEETLTKAKKSTKTKSNAASRKGQGKKVLKQPNVSQNADVNSENVSSAESQLKTDRTNSRAKGHAKVQENSERKNPGASGNTKVNKPKRVQPARFTRLTRSNTAFVEDGRTQSPQQNSPRTSPDGSFSDSPISFRPFTETEQEALEFLSSFESFQYGSDQNLSVTGKVPVDTLGLEDPESDMLNEPVEDLQLTDLDISVEIPRETDNTSDMTSVFDSPQVEITEDSNAGRYVQPQQSSQKGDPLYSMDDSIETARGYSDSETETVTRKVKLKPGTGKGHGKGQRVEDPEVTRSSRVVNRKELGSITKSPCVDNEATNDIPAHIVAHGKDLLIEQLTNAFQMICHFPKPLVYRHVCHSLALLLVKSDPTRAAFYLSEAQAITFRHSAILNIKRKLRKLHKADSGRVAAVADQLKDMSLSEKVQAEEHLTHTQQLLAFDKGVSQHEEIISSLPHGLTVCDVSLLTPYGGKSALVVTHYSPGQQPQVIPMAGFNSPMGQAVLSTFGDIMQQSKDSMHESNKRQWWAGRHEINDRLKALCSEVEEQWLGCWRGLLLGQPRVQDDRNKLDEAAASLVTYCSAHGRASHLVNLNLLRILLNSSHLLNDDEMEQLICVAAQLPVGSQQCQEIRQKARSLEKQMNLEVCERQPVVLILDKNVQHFCWENIPCLRPHPVTRMPNLHFLHVHMTSSRLSEQGNSHFSVGVDPKNTFYVLDPGDDLSNTQSRFQEWFKSEDGWTGVSARVPTTEEITTALTKHDLYIYCGHGSGSKYLAGDNIQLLHCKAVALLMGCSSGKLTVDGELEAMGLMLNYFMAGCPCVVATLWDVTDKDIDRFLEHLLKSWLPCDNGTSLLDSIPPSRDSCRMPYLIGAAVVAYGLPVHSQRLQD